MSVRLQHLFFVAVASAMLTVSALPQERPARVALAIGNASYPEASSPLSSTINDVRAMAEELRRSNFDVDHKENVGSGDMRRAVDAFLSKIRNGASALLYFNGIGIQVGRQTYLIPVDAQISTEAGVRRDGINLDTTLAEMHRRGAKVKIVILDASRRNPFEARFRTSAVGLAAVDAPEGTIAIYSAAPGKVIPDGAGANSLFATELIKELRVPNRTVEEAFNRTRISVSRASNNNQVPWVATSLVEQFSLGQTPPIASTPTPPPDPEAQARRDYQSAEQAGTKKSWDDFVARYPSGRYADLARDQLAKLAPPAVRPKPAETATTPAPPALVAPLPVKPPPVAPPPAASLPAPPPPAAPPPAASLPAPPPPAAPPPAASLPAPPPPAAPPPAASLPAPPPPAAPPPAASLPVTPPPAAPPPAASRPVTPPSAAPPPAASLPAPPPPAAPPPAASLPVTPPPAAPPPAASLPAPPPPAAPPPAASLPAPPPPVAPPPAASLPVTPPPAAAPPPAASTAAVQPTRPPPPAPPGADDPAVRELDTRIQANPDDAAAYYKRGQLYAQHGAFRRAIEDFDAAIRLNPKDAEALNNRCWVRAVVGDLQTALKDCDEALQIRPRYVDAFDSRGFVNLKMSKPRNAITDYDAALQINPRHASALYGRGLAKIQTGNAAGGNSDIAAAKRIQPDIVDEFASYGVR